MELVMAKPGMIYFLHLQDADVRVDRMIRDLRDPNVTIDRELVAQAIEALEGEIERLEEANKRRMW
jgi:hypothetical protein